MRKWIVDTPELLKKKVALYSFSVLAREKDINIKDSNVWVTITLSDGQKKKCHALEVWNGYDYENIRIYCEDEDGNTHHYRMVMLTNKEDNAIFDAMVDTIIDKGIWKKYFQINEN